MVKGAAPSGRRAVLVLIPAQDQSILIVVLLGLDTVFVAEDTIVGKSSSHIAV